LVLPPLISDAEPDDEVPDLISEEEFNQLTIHAIGNRLLSLALF
jgi:hypothetical protein